jgi:hypothetical protein
MDHYWPVENKAVDDVVGNYSAQGNGLPEFAQDRFGVADGALKVHNTKSAWRLPPGNYFKGETTLTMWIKKIICSSVYGTLLFIGTYIFSIFYSKKKYISFTIVSFSSFILSDSESCKDYFLILTENSHWEHREVFGKIVVPVETWYHLSVVYKNRTVSIYVNGTLSGSRSGLIAAFADKAANESSFIGSNDSYSNIVLDEIKLYNKALSQDQLLLDMNVGKNIASGIC